MRIPASFVSSLGLAPGARVAVRVTEERLADRLRERGVTEEEVDSIAGRQLEERENILAFLGAEGSVVEAGSRKRWEAWLASWR